MTLFEQVSESIIAAMKSREKDKLEALRNLKKLMLEARSAKGAGAALTDEESLKLIQKLVKQGKESAEIYEKQNRSDLSDQEMAQVKVLESYLPRPFTDEELTEAVLAIVKETGATSLKDIGKVIGIASRKLAGKAEGKDIAEKVKTFLS
jgi:uncharacterized protein